MSAIIVNAVAVFQQAAYWLVLYRLAAPATHMARPDVVVAQQLNQERVAKASYVTDPVVDPNMYQNEVYHVHRAQDPNMPVREVKFSSLPTGVSIGSYTVVGKDIFVAPLYDPNAINGENEVAGQVTYANGYTEDFTFRFGIIPLAKQAVGA